MKKVSVIGSGNVGVNSAFFIAEMAAANVTLIDIQEGISTGKALDLMEAAPIRSYRTRIDGSDDLASISGSDIVVLAAGKVRTPGHDRAEHLEENAALVRELGRKITDLASESVVVIATEPVDAMVKIFTEETGFDRRKVIGIGGVLDCTRMAHFVAEELGVSPRDVTAMVIGSHTKRMVPVPEFTRVNGIPVGMLLDEGSVSRIVENTRLAGSIIVDLAKRSSAYYAPSAAIAQVVEAVALDTKKVLSVSVLLEGEYGVEGIALSIPCLVGKEGVEKIMDVEFGDAVSEQFLASAELVKSWF
jgi:malate dehydrogenase